MALLPLVPIVLDINLMPIATLDVYQSLIWSDRYFTFGDFEIMSLPVENVMSDVNGGYYLSLPESEHLMVIEHLEINADAVDGDKVIVKGRSLESILYRRVIWDKTVLTGNLQNGIKKLLDENAIVPLDGARQISRLVFEASTDLAITNLTVDTQLMGEYLYDVIADLCLANNIGFKITLREDGKFVFKLYAGVDRSYGQTANAHVLFSPANYNLLNSDYVADDTNSKSVTLVMGGADGSSIIKIPVDSPNGDGTDLERREMFTDAMDITKITPEGTLTETEYLTTLQQGGIDYVAQIKQKGVEDLSKNVVVQTFEGEIDTTSALYVFGVHFFMGDIVQVADGYGHEGESRVTELIHSQDIDGVKIYPTFTTIV